MKSDYNRRAVGAKFEALAAQYLREQGYTLVMQNFRSRRGEIDIIAKDGDTLVFVEVKYRTNRNAGSAEEAVDARKQYRIVQTARYYLLTHGLSEYTTPCRFDVIAFEDGRIAHYENAFTA